jgi:hypothetical protein
MILRQFTTALILLSSTVLSAGEHKFENFNKATQQKIEKEVLDLCAFVAYRNSVFNRTHLTKKAVESIKEIHKDKEWSIDAHKRRNKLVAVALMIHDKKWLNACFEVAENEYFEDFFSQGEDPYLSMLKLKVSLKGRRDKFASKVYASVSN